jgi:hypothetical protein
MQMEDRWKDLVARADAIAAGGWKPKDCIPWLYDLTLSLRSRPDLTKLKEENSAPSAFPALIDRLLADRFWKYSEHPDDSKAPD